MKRTPVIHPLLFGLFPLLFLYAQNALEMKLADIIAPLLLAGGVSVVLTVILGLILRDVIKAGLITTATALLFFSYGHVVNTIPEFKYPMVESILGPSLLVLLIWCALLYLGISLALRTRRDLRPLTIVLNRLGLALVLIQVVHGGFIMASRSDSGDDKEFVITSGKQIERRPDIYYIIVDGYGRSDILREIYDFDNSAFIDQLRELGFYVADSSYANYPQTLLSLATSLNMNYVEELGEFDPTSKDRVPLGKKLKNSAVVEFLCELGYTTVAFASGYGFTDLNNSDSYFSPSWTTSEYQNMLISTTPLPLFTGGKQSPFAIHRHRITYVLDKLSELSDVDSPKFIFAHIISPHPPFVFDAEGQPVRPKGRWTLADGSHFIKDSTDLEEYVQSYRAQISYISDRLLETIAGIIDASGDESPVIVLQADHGPGIGLNWGDPRKTNLRERFSILNAYHLPGLEENPIYDEISPVNSFRIVFNQYFGTELELLPDKHIYAPWSKPYAFRPVSLSLGGSAYDHLMEQYRSLPPDSIPFDEICQRKERGTQYNALGNRLISEVGLCVQFPAVQHSGQLEISVDHNDSYQLQYRSDTAVIAVDTVVSHWMKGGGLRIDTLVIPADVYRSGYDNIVLYPLRGDGLYAVGHILLL